VHSTSTRFGKTLHSGKPTYLHDVNDSDWLPSLHLGHKKGTVSVGNNKHVARYKRLKNTEKKKAIKFYEEMVEQVSVIVAYFIKIVAAEECHLICAEQIKIHPVKSAHVKTEGVKTCDCSKKVEELQEQLVESKKMIGSLTTIF